MNETLKVLLNGAKGRMGTAISAEAPQSNAEIVEALDVDHCIDDCAAECDVLIDFSFHEATLSAVEWCVSKKVPIVIGTTGHSPDARKRIHALASEIPIIWSGNYSVGVNLLNYLTSKAAAILQDGYDAELIEMHHHHKRDAPSGTAERLLEILKASRNLTEDQLTHGRSGITGARPKNEIGVHAIRGGDIVGEHTVMFAGEGERIELTHKATDRRIFAAGAIRAGHWAVTQKPGLYNMEDVLGLR